MKIGIVGSRMANINTATLNKILEVCASISTKDSYHLVSGGAIGIDTDAQRLAQIVGYPITIHYPKLTTSNDHKIAYFARNKRIAEDSAILIAFCRENQRSGTLNTISHMKKLRKPIFLIDPWRKPYEVLRWDYDKELFEIFPIDIEVVDIL